MSDLISRQDAIRLAEQGQIQGFEWQFKKLCELPSADPERKTGKWIKQDCGGVEYTAVCSECGYGTFWSDASDFNFCPNCGIKMEGDAE